MRNIENNIDFKRERSVLEDKIRDEKIDNEEIISCYATFCNKYGHQLNTEAKSKIFNDFFVLIKQYRWLIYWNTRKHLTREKQFENFSFNVATLF